MSHEEYEAIDAVNHSLLKWMGVSPRHFDFASRTPRPNTKVFGLGRAVHAAILEPERFLRDSVVCTLSRGTKAWELFEALRSTTDAPAVYHGKVRRGQAWEDFEALHQGQVIALEKEWDIVRQLIEAVRSGREVVTQQELDVALAAAKSVHDHPAASRLLTGGEAEKAITWTDTDTGLNCKARLDYLRPEMVVELKSARDIRPRKFGFAATDLGYLSQLAFYCDGAGVDRAQVVAVESAEPFDVVVYDVPGAALDAGRATYRGWLRRVAECRAAGRWPGISDATMEMELPERAFGEPDSGLDFTGIEEGAEA